jgi:hypothetical protein
MDVTRKHLEVLTIPTEEQLEVLICAVTGLKRSELFNICEREIPTILKLAFANLSFATN